MGKSYREQTYGGRLVENMVQGIARDIMCVGALNAANVEYDIFALIHDEIVSLCNDQVDKEYLKKDLRELLLSLPDWTAGLPLDAEVKAMYRYSK